MYWDHGQATKGAWESDLTKQKKGVVVMTTPFFCMTRSCLSQRNLWARTSGDCARQAVEGPGRSATIEVRRR